MVLRLALFPFIEAQSLSFVLVCVCYESTRLPKQSQPSIVFTAFSAIDGGAGSCKLPSGHGYRGIGLWEMVWGEQGSVLGRWFGLETMGEGGVVLAVNGLRYRVGCNGLKRSMGKRQNWPSIFGSLFISFEPSFSYKRVWKVTVMALVVL
ncbi:hypothetical protein Tco_0183031 [Tanacetum coccineum]